jgi:intracellular sulfur oxidation DsrE/DsrF family protein
MDNSEYTDDKLNMFIDGELDSAETNALHETLLKNPELRERVCQLKAVRELVGFAYQSPPRSNLERRVRPDDPRSSLWKGVAAALLLCLGVVVGWSTHQFGPSVIAGTTTANNVFSYYTEHTPAKHVGRNFILHLTTSDIGAVKSALDEADNLIASYKRTNTPLKIDIIANQSGIDVLRVDVSPYIARIKKMVAENDSVSLFACERSLAKAKAREGRDIVVIPETVTNKTARELIPERLNDGWVYIKV